jgi:hypothetical protein
VSKLEAVADLWGEAIDLADLRPPVEHAARRYFSLDNRAPVPLTDFESDLLRLCASLRDVERRGLRALRVQEPSRWQSAYAHGGLGCLARHRSPDRAR